MARNVAARAAHAHFRRGLNFFTLSNKPCIHSFIHGAREEGAGVAAAGVQRIEFQTETLLKEKHSGLGEICRIYKQMKAAKKHEGKVYSSTTDHNGESAKSTRHLSFSCQTRCGALRQNTSLLKIV